VPPAQPHDEIIDLLMTLKRIRLRAEYIPTWRYYPISGLGYEQVLISRLTQAITTNSALLPIDYSFSIFTTSDCDYIDDFSTFDCIYLQGNRTNGRTLPFKDACVLCTTSIGRPHQIRQNGRKCLDRGLVRARALAG
jgi:hypothetical protein